MIFTDSKKTCEKLAEILKKAEIKNLPFHNGLGLQTRQHTLQLFQNRDLPVIVSTNIGARGLDTMHVNHVI